MNVLDSVFEGREPVTHDEAKVAAQALIDHFFKNKDSTGVLITIPAAHDNTDLILLRYIQEQERNAPRT